jgi:7-carboxy-7-deazaguanine synthase
VTTLAAPTAQLRQRTHPVIEVFGPTIQGEGAEAGLPTHFIRLGGCDYRCSWCDTMYAVEPRVVRETAERLAAHAIVARLRALEGRPDWVTVSGGNPALHHLDDLVDELHRDGYKVAVETQGSVWRSWLSTVDRLTISPKPPSSGMATMRHARQFDEFMLSATEALDRAVFKIVCFDESDLRWGANLVRRWPNVPVFLSAGTPVPTPADVRAAVGARYRWLCERVAADPSWAAARVLPQLHVIAWEGATGV